ncbi:hypothetical protein JOQ06_028396 [Pogonophryne albipinna]|uniref:Endonuclease LCL3 n=2 Tax=Notothenioidei TaxID=8205 RepID=A0AAD9FAP0_DISEL|nr:hypothetical protein JOQ06_028396 [Pogonophryne albipinna]KAK1894291.1 putative endonuclease LCL3 [Dissostichus eleginoides]
MLHSASEKGGTGEDGMLPACLLRGPSLCMTWTQALVTRLAPAYVSSPSEGSGAAMWHLLPGGRPRGWGLALCSPGLSAEL